MRFKTSFVDSYQNTRYGVFQAAYHLLHSSDMYLYDEERLKEVWKWFRNNLLAPDVFKQSKREVNAICWYKPDAKEHLQKMYEMIHILELYGYHVWQIKCHNPGYIVYEDDEQVAVIPHGKLFRGVR